MCILLQNKLQIIKVSRSQAKIIKKKSFKRYHILKVQFCFVNFSNDIYLFKLSLFSSQNKD